MDKTTSLLMGMLLSLYLTGGHTATTAPSPLVNSNWLDKHLKDVTVLSIRADIKSFTQKPAFKKNKKTAKKKLARVGGHIPGASLINYKKIRAKQMIDGRKVQKMLPARADFEKIIQAAGVNKNDTIIISSKGQSTSDILMATRLYWQLKYYGHDQLAILDGGLAAWTMAGKPVATNKENKATGNWKSGKINSSVLAQSQDVEQAIDKKSQLIDSRSLGQYLGTWKKSYVYNAGHIPQAKYFPTELLTKQSMPVTFLPKQELQGVYKVMGLESSKPSINYCNSGLLATGSWFVLSELLGNKQSSMYDGSMHQWTLENRPVNKLIME